MRFKCLTDSALETCYETERCFTDENKDATECPSIDEVATGLNVFDMQELNENGLGVLNLFVDFKVLFRIFSLKIHIFKDRNHRKMD